MSEPSKKSLEVAREIVADYFYYRAKCAFKNKIDNVSDLALVQAIKKALDAARDEALEEAALVLDKWSTPSVDATKQATNKLLIASLARDIRALKSKGVSDEK